MAVDFIMHGIVKPSNKCEVTANIFRNVQWHAKVWEPLVESVKM